jgi:hypothetical protein
MSEEHDEYVQLIIKEYREKEEKVGEKRQVQKNVTMEEVEDENAPEIFYNALDHCQDPPKPSWKEQVPQQFHKFTKVFDKEKSE